jgi:hypothetical protein
MKTLAAHGLAGGIVQDRMGGSFGAGFLAGSVGSYFGSSGKSSKANEIIGNTAIEAVIGGTGFSDNKMHCFTHYTSQHMLNLGSSRVGQHNRTVLEPEDY